MDSFLIGITKSKAAGLEGLLNDIDYNKMVDNGIVYFDFTIDGWKDSFNEFPSTLMSYLFLVVGMDSYGFVRMGEDAEDTEVHGVPYNFNIGITRTVEIYE